MREILLYHGSKEEVVYPEIRITRYTKDFSWGFYCTNNYQQAYSRRSFRLHYAASGVYGWSTTFIYKGETTMEFFNSAIEVLQTLVVALGAGLGVWGAINLLEGYGNDNRAMRS